MKAPKIILIALSLLVLVVIALIVWAAKSCPLPEGREQTISEMACVTEFWLSRYQAGITAVFAAIVAGCLAIPVFRQYSLAAQSTALQALPLARERIAAATEEEHSLRQLRAEIEGFRNYFADRRAPPATMNHQPPELGNAAAYLHQMRARFLHENQVPGAGKQRERLKEALAALDEEADFEWNWREKEWRTLASGPGIPDQTQEEIARRARLIDDLRTAIAAFEPLLAAETERRRATLAELSRLAAGEEKS